MKKLIAFIILVFASANTFAQCAMCRATLENNVSNGNPGIALGINFGILYLFFAPYISIAALAFFWFRASRRNALKTSV